MTYLLQKIGLRPTFCLLLIIRWGTENLRLSYTMLKSRSCNVDDPECWRVQAAAQLQSDGRLQARDTGPVFASAHCTLQTREHPGVGVLFLENIIFHS